VLWRFTSRGIHSGPLGNIPTTGKAGSVTGMVLFRFEKDQVAEVWVNIDMLGLLQQLGIIPAMA
jgi:predicted ester cyclase